MSRTEGSRTQTFQARHVPNWDELVNLVSDLLCGCIFLTFYEKSNVPLHGENRGYEVGNFSASAQSPGKYVARGLAPLLSSLSAVPPTSSGPLALSPSLVRRGRFRVPAHSQEAAGRALGVSIPGDGPLVQEKAVSARLEPPGSACSPSSLFTGGSHFLTQLITTIFSFALLEARHGDCPSALRRWGLMSGTREDGP